MAPLVALQTLALEAAAESGWDDGVPALGENRLADGTPLLHGMILTVDPRRQAALLARLANALPEPRAEVATSSDLGDLLRSGRIDPLTLLAASTTQDAERIEELAAEQETDPAILAVVAHAATLPLLLACGRRAEPMVRSAGWARGFCPVCAAWPTLAEVRGLARDFILRCGRCAAAWKGDASRCIFCGNQDHQTFGYLAGEQERESRRALVCDACSGYLKSATTLGALDAAGLLALDLRTLELDMAALEAGYERPEAFSDSMTITMQAAVPGAASADTAPAADTEIGRPEQRRGWRRWLG